METLKYFNTKLARIAKQSRKDRPMVQSEQMIVSSYLSVSKTWIFLCYWVTTFSVFSISLSLFFFPKLQKLRCTLYTGAHYMVHKCWLVRKRKNRLFQASIHLGTVRSKIHYFFYWGMNIFFFCLSKKCLKSLICTVLEYQTICYYNPKFPNREYDLFVFFLSLFILYLMCM